MKKLLCVCAFSVVATTAYSGSYQEPYIEPEIVVTETVKSAGSDEWVFIMMTLITVGLGVVGN